MKHYIFILLFIGFGMIGDCQTKFGRVYSTPIPISEFDSMKWVITPMVTYFSDGEVEIRGCPDTLTAIRMLLNELGRRDSVSMELGELIDAGVDFLNHVPDYWKTKEHNANWNKYFGLLRKQGYHETTKKRKP